MSDSSVHATGAGVPPRVSVRIVKASGDVDKPITKADGPTQLDTQEARAASEWVNPPYPLKGLAELARNSNILPQCIHAYKNNITGFGIGLRYRDEFEDETEEMKQEWTQAQEIIDLLSLDMDTKEVFGNAVEGREKYGIAYLEVMRDLEGNVNAVDYIRDIPSVEKTYPLDPAVDATYCYKGKEITRPKKFCKYRQSVGGKTVYFKEFGDPRTMNKQDGNYRAKDGEEIPLEFQANEILEYAIGTEIYGEVRWFGQILGIDGSRSAEGLNNRYFSEGRHTPLMIMVKGGTLTDDSFEKLQQYMDGIKGEKGQHAFLVLEVENTDTQPGFDDTKKPEIEVKDLASILQKDELFQEYISNNRKRVQSAFQLPDLYVGYTTDFNRATAQTAMEVTEEQVFQPERKSLAWIINNKLLNGYHFKYVEAEFKSPDFSNADDLFKILTVAEKAGGLSMNKAKELAHKALGGTSEDYDEEWGNLPLVYLQMLNSTQTAVTPGLMGQFDAQIKKAAAENNDEVVAVMKSVRALLAGMQEGGKSA